MLNIKGTHGTCLSRSNQIQKYGFKAPTHSGKLGRGIYLWSYSKNPIRAHRLAVNWFQKSLDDGKYTNEEKKSLSVIYVEVKVKKDEYCDVSRDMFVEVCEETLEKAPNLTQFEVVEWLLEKLEVETGKKFSVIYGSTTLFCKRNTVDSIFGSAKAYVLRCIENLDIR